VDIANKTSGTGRAFCPTYPDRTDVKREAVTVSICGRGSGSRCKETPRVMGMFPVGAHSGVVGASPVASNQRVTSLPAVGVVATRGAGCPDSGQSVASPVRHEQLVPATTPWMAAQARP
jgi:hypothetical protein